MPTFTLETSFSHDDLNRLYATGTNVVVAKPTEGGGTPNVAWVVFRPLEGNQMTWEEKYGIYASNAEVQHGAHLLQMSTTDFPANDDKIYTLDSDAVFAAPTSGGTKNAFTAVNHYDNLPPKPDPNGKGYLTFGLFQDAIVNGAKKEGHAVSAAPVLYKSTATMTPYTTVYLWTQSQVKSNTVVTNVTSPMTRVVFGGPVSEVSLAYDADSGMFVPAGNLAEGIALEEHLPLAA